MAGCGEVAEFRAIHERIGKYTHGNPISFPAGSAKIVENFEATRDNVYKKCRGRSAYGTGLPVSDIKQIMEYQKRVHLHLNNNNIWYDSDGLGTFILLAGAELQPDVNTLMHDLEFAGNMYYTSSTGIKLFDTLGSAPMSAGEPQGLSMDIRLSFGGGWFNDISAVSYRHVWTYIDANNNKTTGAPSERIDIGNGLGFGTAVTLGIYIPDGITTNHYLEVYRSSVVTPLAVIPPEDYQLCYMIKPTAGQIAARYLEFEDILPEGFKGVTLYTNTTKEGLAQANSNPPLCKTFDKYRGFLFFGDVTGLSRLYTALISIDFFTAGVSTLTIDDGTNTMTFGCYDEVVPMVVIATANVGGEVEIQTGAAHGLASGDYVHIYEVTGTVEANGIWEIFVTGADTFTLVGSVYVNAWIAGGIVVQYEDYGATPRFILYTGGTVAQNIDNTARSIVRVINMAIGNTWWYAYYNSSVSDPPGKIMITGREIDNVQFYLTVDDTLTTGANFSPIIPDAGITYISSASSFINGLMYSKEQEGEHVPLVNIFYVGTKNDPILKVIGLKDSLIIIKSDDGIFRLTGTSPTNFVITELDGTCKCLQKESIVKGDNAVFMMSNQGKVKISDSGVEVIGRDNEYEDFKPVNNVDFATKGYGWYYNTEKNYYLSTMKDENSTDFDIVSVYNTFTQAWTDRIYGVTTSDTQIRCARVINDVCYYAPLTGNGLLRERKSYTALDFVTPDIAVTITNVDLVTNEITINAAITIVKGAIFSQGVFNSVVLIVSDTTHFIVVDASSFINGAATVRPGVISKIKYHQCHCNMPDIEKDFQELVLLFDDAETNIENILIALYTDQLKLKSPVTDMQGVLHLWGLPDWGDYWLLTAVTDKWRTNFPAEYSKGSYAYLEIEHTNAEEQVALCGYAVEYDPINTKSGRQ